jgi:hypothetical protein
VLIAIGIVVAGTQAHLSGELVADKPDDTCR